MRASFLSLLLLLFIGLPADAHNRSQSFSQWTIDNNQLQMLFTVKAREATRLLDNRRSSLETVLAEHLSATLSVTQGDAQCGLSTGTGIGPLSAKPGYLRLGASFNCSGSLAEKPPTIQIGSFFPVASTHVHYARIAATGAISARNICLQRVANSTRLPWLRANGQIASNEPLPSTQRWGWNISLLVSTILHFCWRCYYCCSLCEAWC